MVPPIDAGEKHVPEENLPQNLSARDAALEALARVEDGAGLLRDELHDLFKQCDLEPRDRGLALQLAAGAIRHRRTLRLVINHLRGRRGREATIQPPLRRILELGAFQLLFLDRVPAYAVLNEAAEAARRTVGARSGDKTAGFVNGVLRGLSRLIAGRDPDGRPARNALPHPEGGVVRLQQPVLPDPKDGRAAFLGAAYSFPDWLVARWLEAFGERAEELCRWSNRRPRVFARINPIREGYLSPEELVEGTHAGSVDVSEIESERLETILTEGSLTVQDPSAMLAVEALAPAPGENVLDLCASPGTKTTQIVEAMGGRGRVVACDRSEDKLLPIRETVDSRGLANVTVCLSDAVASAAPPGGFDAALVDAPCSNTGVLARRVEVRWRLRPDDLQDLPQVQGELLARAAGLVRPGGRLVYSTCSLQREENDEVVGRFLKVSPDWRLVRSNLTYPGADHDGAFWSLLSR
ncbi:MAG: methyltransferase domain-containing protein [Planctomycetota bacterium]|nr:methyltransferase domain-containing protein [Planctomycetota bacterium]